ncbi:MAG TPA: 30S ribosomal protein S21 [Alphaproteobacteria bacterium]|nr:30S ribosomal protein S21 [Alphaproteobacteria bacterium]
MSVRVMDGQLDHALRRLKRQLARDGILRELRQRAFYERPSVRRRRKQRIAERRRRKLAQRLSA